MSGIYCTLYIRNTSLLLEKQIETAPDSKKKFQSDSYTPKSHSMSAAVEVYACSKVEQHVKRSTKLNSAWKPAKEESTQSVVEKVQISSDKSQTSMNASCLKILPFSYYVS